MAKPKLTQKQAKFVKGVVEGKPAYKAALEAYDTDKYEVANAIAVENLQKPSIREALDAEFEKQGITLERIVKPINDALDASKTVILGSGEEAFADVVPDHGIRLKAVGLAAQFMGIGKDKTVPSEVHFHNHQASQREKYNL